MKGNLFSLAMISTILALEPTRRVKRIFVGTNVLERMNAGTTAKELGMSHVPQGVAIFLNTELPPDAGVFEYSDGTFERFGKWPSVDVETPSETPPAAAHEKPRERHGCGSFACEKDPKGCHCHCRRCKRARGRQT